jgi:hypothetical protein
MHHFCSHDIAALVGLEDFGDECYCSTNCYYRRRNVITTPNLSMSMGMVLNESVEVSPSTVCAVCGEVNSFKKKCTKCDKYVHEECSRQVHISTGGGLDNNVVLCSTRCYKSFKPDVRPVEENLPHPFVGKEVAFSPQEEPWMDPKLHKSNKVYADIGSMYLFGIVSRVVKNRTKKNEESKKGEKTKKGAKNKKDENKTKEEFLFEVVWNETQLSKRSMMHKITLEQVQRGISNRERFLRDPTPGESWQELKKIEPVPNVIFDVSDEADLDVLGDSFKRFHIKPSKVSNLEEVEKIASLNFTTHGYIKGPHELYPEMDAKLKGQYKERFLWSASSAFFAYLPVSFWKSVVDNTNIHVASDKKNPIDLDELMKFFGILFHMATIDKGEYKNYWGTQIDAPILSKSEKMSLDTIMPLSRFKFIRKHLSFRAVVPADELKRDPAARLRPLINQLKLRSPKYVDVGRNVSVDEASVACRSKFARHLIVYNPSKPTGESGI